MSSALPVQDPQPSLRESVAAGGTAHHLALRVARHVGIILAFTVPSIIIWWHVWSSSPTTTVSCPCLDSGQEIWFIGWPAYALSHATLPFFSSALWSPGGVNLLNNTSAPLTGILLSPVTWTFGPVLSTNLALTLAPGLTAWSGWWACRRFVSWPPAAVLGGLLFGYSPFVVSSVALGHLSLALLIVPPFVVVLLHEICVRQQMKPGVAGLLLGLLICVQFMISVEVLAIMGIAAGVGLVVAAVLSPEMARAALPYAGRALGVALMIAVVLLAWPTWYLLAGPRHISGTPIAGIASVDGQLFHLWSAGPTYTFFNATTKLVVGTPVDFVGVGVVALALASLAVARRRALSWVLATVALVGVVLSWGTSIWLSPTHRMTGVWLPWRIFTAFPVLRDVAPIRFALVVDLACVLLIVIGIDTVSRWALFRRPAEAVGQASQRTAVTGPGVGARTRRVSIVFTACALAALALAVLPQWLTYQVPLPTQRVTLPPWFATAGKRIAPGSTVLTVPFPMSSTLVSEPLVWQAVDGMRFRLAGGYVKVPGGSGQALTTGAPGSAVRLLFDLTAEPSPGPSTMSAGRLQSLRVAIRRWDVSAIVVNDLGARPSLAAAVFTATTTEEPERFQGSWVWNLTRADRAEPFSAVNASDALRRCVDTSSDGLAGGSNSPANRRLNACIVNDLAAGGEAATGP